MRREEANEDVRLSVVGALGAFLSCLDSWPASAMSRLRDGLGEKEALRRAHLRALVQVRYARLMALLPCGAAAPLLLRQCRLQASLCMLQALGSRPQARSQVGLLDGSAQQGGRGGPGEAHSARGWAGSAAGCGVCEHRR